MHALLFNSSSYINRIACHHPPIWPASAQWFQVMLESFGLGVGSSSPPCASISKRTSKSIISYSSKYGQPTSAIRLAWLTSQMIVHRTSKVQIPSLNKVVLLSTLVHQIKRPGTLSRVNESWTFMRCNCMGRLGTQRLRSCITCYNATWLCQ